MANRTYTTRRQSIVDAIVTKLRVIDGSGTYHTNLADNISPRLLFWDEVTEFPAVHISAGREAREYLTGGVKNRFLTVTLRCYVNEEDAVNALDALLEDVETVLEENYPGTETLETVQLRLPTALHLMADYHLKNKFYLNVQSSLSMISNTQERANRITNSLTLSPRIETK